ncbi:hypothetical protein [Enterobacter cloacae complex sp. 288G10]|uniref:hypothetical protein n=1 Tax=Enterobacter cloacae complex sp. 288G10 TaxID=3395859 RepID=UPI003CF71E4B
MKIPVPTRIWRRDFVSGFAPVSESLFNEVKSAEWGCTDAIAATCAYMGNPECFALLWPRAGEFGLEQLELKSSDVDELDPEYHQQFQAIYPELSMLSPAAIQRAYDEYCESMWEYPERCDGFLYHLIGSTVSLNWRQPGKTGRLIALMAEEPRLRMPIVLAQRLSSSIPLFLGWRIRYPWP